MKPVEIGQILILREEFRKVATNPKQPGGLVVRAEILVRLLDELIARREKEAADLELSPDSNASEGQ
jgi:hypothetical protein